MTVTALRNHQPPASLEGVEDLTSLCKALADSLRLEILRLLRTGSFGVLEICRIFGIRQSALSHHLKILSRAGLVSTRREGNTIFYRRPLLLNDDPLYDFRKQAFETVDRVPIREEVLLRISEIQQERSQQSLSFFTRNADKFREKQGLVTEYSQYAGSLQDLLGEIDLIDEARVMEVGPGEGELLLKLAEQYRDVLALDNSLEMLNKAKATIAARELSNVTFIHGDTHVALEEKLRCDLLILNMVLHHISSPADAFLDSAALLNDGGTLLIVDLSRHDQDWVRDSCGDLWLGFDTEDLNDWARQASLVPEQSLYLGLRNGFQIQMRIFIKRQSV